MMENIDVVDIMIAEKENVIQVPSSKTLSKTAPERSQPNEGDDV